MRLTRLVFTVAMGVAALIHLLPLAGLAGAQTLQRLYGVAIADASLMVLLQHRAVLFGLLGALLLAAMRVDALRGAALLGGWVSCGGFLVLSVGAGPLSVEVQRVLWFDAVALVSLVMATVAYGRMRRPG